MKIELLNHKNIELWMKTIPIRDTKNSSQHYKSYPLKQWLVTLIFFANKCKIVILAIWEYHLRSKQSISNTRSTSQQQQPKRSTFGKKSFSAAFGSHRKLSTVHTKYLERKTGHKWKICKIFSQTRSQWALIRF